MLNLRKCDNFYYSKNFAPLQLTRQADPLNEEGSPELKETRNRSIKKNINFLLMLVI